MLQVARGLHSRDDLRADLAEIIGDGEFADFYPDDPEPGLEEAWAVLDEVIAEHDRVVVEAAPEGLALARALGSLVTRGVAVSPGEGVDFDDAHDAGLERADELAELTGSPVLGFAFLSTQDVDRLVLTERTTVGFDATSGEDDDMVAVGRIVVETLHEAGVEVEWDETPGRRIVVTARWEIPFRSHDPSVG